MSSEEIVFSLLVAVIGASLGVLISICIDWNAARRNAVVNEAMRRVRGIHRRWVTVLIPVQSNASVIELLGQLAKNRYTQFDVVLVDERGDAPQAKALRLHVAGRKFRFSVGVLVRRKKSSSVQMLKAAYKKSLRGEIAMVLEDTAGVDRLFVKRTVALYNTAQGRSEVRVRTPKASVPSPRLELTELTSGLSQRLFSFKPSVLAGNWRKVTREYETSRSNHHFYKGVSVVVLLGIVLAGVRLGVELSTLWYAWLFAFGYCLAAVWSASFIAVSQRVRYSSIASVALFLIPVHSLFSGLFQLTSRK